MKINMLLDSYIESGTNIFELENLLFRLDSATTAIDANSDDLQLLHLVGKRDDRLVFHKFTESQKERKEAPAPVGMGIPLMKSHGCTPEFMHELAETKLCIIHNGTVYFTSSSLSRDLGDLAEVKGRGMQDPTLDRASFLMSRFVAEPKKAKLVIRRNSAENGKIQKIIAVGSENYCHVPQSILIEVIKNFGQDVGACECKQWVVSTGLTEIYVEFPEKAKDFADVYKLPNGIVPGLILRTSSTRDCSVKAIGTVRFQKSKSLVKTEEYTRKHSGEFDEKDLLTGIEDKVFANYTKLPERLCDLLSINLTDPTTVIEFVMKHIGGENEIGKRLCKKVTEEMQMEINPHLQYSAYDIAMMFLDLPSRIEGDGDIKEYVKSKIQRAVYRAPFAEFEKFKTQTIANLHLA